MSSRQSLRKIALTTNGVKTTNLLANAAVTSSFNLTFPPTTPTITGQSLISDTAGNLSWATALSSISLRLANAANSGSVSSTAGTYLSIQNQTYTDTVTAASTTSAGTFSASYLGIPTLAATNTAVTTTVASTLTIAGPPVAGTNETLTNAYALNIQAGNALLSSGYIISSNLPTVALGATNQSFALSAGNSAIPAAYFSIISSTGPTMATAGSNVITIPRKGIYTINAQVLISSTSASNLGVYVLGSNNIYYGLHYSYAPANFGCYVTCTGCREIPSGVTLTPFVYTANAGTLIATISGLAFFTVTGHSMTL